MLSRDIPKSKEKLYDCKPTYNRAKKRRREQEQEDNVGDNDAENNSNIVNTITKKQKILSMEEGAALKHFGGFLRKFLNREILESEMSFSMDTFSFYCATCAKNLKVGYSLTKAKLPSFSYTNLVKHKCFKAQIITPSQDTAETGQTGDVLNTQNIQVLAVQEAGQTGDVTLNTQNIQVLQINEDSGIYEMLPEND